MTKQQKQARNMVHGHYDSIFQTVKGIAKHYSVKRVPITLINNVLDKGKLELNPEATQEGLLFLEKMNETIETLRTGCVNQSLIIGDGAISINEFGMMIGELKTAFDNGLTQANDTGQQV